MYGFINQDLHLLQKGMPDLVVRWQQLSENLVQPPKSQIPMRPKPLGPQGLKPTSAQKPPSSDDLRTLYNLECPKLNRQNTDSKDLDEDSQPRSSNYQQGTHKGDRAGSGSAHKEQLRWRQP